MARRGSCGAATWGHACSDRCDVTIDHLMPDMFAQDSPPRGLNMKATALNFQGCRCEVA